MATYLDEIMAAHRAAAQADSRSVDELAARAAVAPHPRDFAAALTGDGVSVIAEIKRRSPSKGLLSPALVPEALAKEYALGGAAALSVLTDESFFGGSAADLMAARSSVDLPVLRKDFTVGPLDVLDARLMGADALLVIVAALDDAELKELLELTQELGLAALVEAHDEREVDRALAAGAGIVGVNQRDLVTFRVDADRAVRVAAAIPDGVIKVAESGITTTDGAARLADAGYDAILVGEHLVTSGDPARAVSELVAACS